MENGISCKFTTRVIRCQPQAICLELPRSIQRTQRRAYIRLAASSNAEIIFRVAGKEEKARVRDYSLGGISFFMANQQKLNIEEELKDLILILPHDKAAVSYQISQAIVWRIDEHFEDKKRICALKFLKLEKKTQQELARHIFEEQRLSLRGGRKV
jgi:c-di-GMP-binding flagellar brake protein YcgR